MKNTRHNRYSLAALYETLYYDQYVYVGRGLCTNSCRNNTESETLQRHTIYLCNDDNNNDNNNNTFLIFYPVTKSDILSICSGVKYREKD